MQCHTTLVGFRSKRTRETFCTHNLSTSCRCSHRHSLPEALPWIAAALVMATVDAAVRWAARVPGSPQTTKRFSADPSSHCDQAPVIKAPSPLTVAATWLPDTVQDADKLDKEPTWWRRPCFYMLLHTTPAPAGLLVFHDGEDTIVPVYEVRSALSL